MEFSIDFGNVSPPPAPPVDVPLYAAAPGIVLPLGPEECVFRLHADGSHHVMTRPVFDALHACRAFAGLDAHAAAVVRSVAAAGGRHDVARRMLEQLAERRLLLSADDWLSALAHDQPPADAPLRAVFIDTADRPATLAALLADLEALELGHRGGHRYVVLDRSVGSAAIRANAEAVAQLAAAAGVRAWHVDAARWQALVVRAERALGGQRAAVETLLGREGETRAPGCARNLAAWLAAGSRYAWLDDRQRLPLHRRGDVPAAVVFADLPQHEIDFLDDAATALATGVAVPGDPFASQLAWCGQRLGHVFGTGALARPSRRQLAGLQPAALSAIGPRSRIRATSVGSRGSSRRPDREWMYTLGPAARAALCRDRDHYLRQLDSPAVWIAPGSPQLVSTGVPAPFLVDAASLTAPTLADDDGGLQSLLERALDPHALVLALDQTTGRTADPGRPVPVGQSVPTLATLLADLLPERIGGLRAETPGARLRGLVGFVADLAAAPAAMRSELVGEYLAFHRADHITHLQESFAAANDAPVFWQADAREAIAAHGRALTTAGSHALSGWPSELDARAAAERFARDLDRFADGLAQWPALSELGAAQGLRLLDA
jgi:hypothetical protein